MNSKPCEWCDKDTTTRCSQCREIHLCSKACMKLIWKEHKRTCERVEQAGSAVDALTEDLRELSVETEGRRAGGSSSRSSRSSSRSTWTW